MGTADPFSVPRHLFGDVPEAFFADLGRVAMLAALLDQRLQDLYVQMTHADQTHRAGDYGTQLIAICSTRLTVFAPDQRDHVAGFFAAARSALHQRNAVLHSLWVFSGDAEHGWRYSRPSGGRPSEMVEQEINQLPRLVSDLVSLNEECSNVMAMVRHSEVV